MVQIARKRHGAKQLLIQHALPALLVTAILCLCSFTVMPIHANSDVGSLNMPAKNNDILLGGSLSRQIVENDDSEESTTSQAFAKDVLKQEVPNTIDLRGTVANDNSKRRHGIVGPIPAPTSTQDEAGGDRDNKPKSNSSKLSAEQFAVLPDHCSEPKSGEIVIKGERHSGTNFMERILRQNTRTDVNQVMPIAAGSTKYGWKHGFLPPLGGTGQPFDSRRDTLVVVTRDAFVWLSKMMDEAYDPIMNAKKENGFSSYIRAPYSNICHDDPEKEERKVVCETAANLVQIRTQKYKQWLSDDPDGATYVGTKESFLRSRVHVRLESVAVAPNDADLTKHRQLEHIREPLAKTCVFVLPDFVFRPVLQHTTNNIVKNRERRTIDPIEEKKEMLQKYSKEDLRFVLSQLDMEFEKQIGYDYGYVYEILGEI